jgi:hypothetical protein
VHACRWGPGGKRAQDKTRGIKMEKHAALAGLFALFRAIYSYEYS